MAPQNTVASEAHQLEETIKSARLTINEEIAAWDVWEQHGMNRALGVVRAFKGQPDVSLKAAPADWADQLGQQFAAALRTRAQTAGSDQSQVEVYAQIVIAQLSGQKAPVSSKLTDSGKMSVKAAPPKKPDPYAAAVRAAFGPENPAAQPAPTLGQIAAAIAAERPEVPKDPLTAWHADKRGGGDIH